MGAAGKAGGAGDGQERRGVREADLYAPAKAYLEKQGYAVKAEIGACDLMAVRDGEPPLVVELKLAFSLDLVMQGVDRQAMFDTVYLAAPLSGSRTWPKRRRDVLRLCRRLGLGLLDIDLDGAGVAALLDPGPFRQAKRAKPAARLLREFERRVGDPNVGGSAGVKRITAYRQDALRCALHLAAHGPTKAAEVARAAGAARAAAIMRADHYGWFERTARGVYGLTPVGAAALVEFAPTVALLRAA